MPISQSLQPNMNKEIKDKEENTPKEVPETDKPNQAPVQRRKKNIKWQPLKEKIGSQPYKKMGSPTKEIVPNAKDPSSKGPEGVSHGHQKKKNFEGQDKASSPTTPTDADVPTQTGGMAPKANGSMNNRGYRSSYRGGGRGGMMRGQGRVNTQSKEKDKSGEVPGPGPHPIGAPQIPPGAFYPTTHPHQFYQPMAGKGQPFIYPAPLPMAEKSPELKAKIIQQFRWYFGKENLCRDVHLRLQFDTEGWVPLDFCAQFQKVKNLTLDVEYLFDCLQDLDIVEFQIDPKTGAKKIRSIDWIDWVFPENAAPPFHPAMAYPMMHHQPMMYPPPARGGGGMVYPVPPRGGYYFPPPGVVPQQQIPFHPPGPHHNPKDIVHTKETLPKKETVNITTHEPVNNNSDESHSPQTPDTHHHFPDDEKIIQ